MRQFTGDSRNAQSPILGAEFWKKGTKIEGTVVRSFDTKNGTCYEVVTNKPVNVNGEQQKKVSVGALKGFQMALGDCGLEQLEAGDKVIIEATGKTESGKGNDMVQFKLTVGRED